ncbi:MAG: hydrogenase maturation nickel metallochaperone HypA [Dehalococcoidia bacterium]|jgi:hydrogenase nickel incorporation protein HypA/HybF
MHELSITQSMLDLVLEQTKNAGAKEVGKINLVIGEMTGVVDRSVRFYFDFLSKGTAAEGAELHFEVVPTTARCHSCWKDFALGEFDWTCPHCRGNNIEIVGGKELFVESIEVN